MRENLPHLSPGGRLQVPVARLVGLNRPLVSLVQEFLEIHGYVVVLNREPTTPYNRTIICGDTSFVNKFFAGKQDSAPERLILVYDVPEDEARLLVAHKKVKVCFLPPGAYGTREVERAFAFFSHDDGPFYRLAPKTRVVPTVPADKKIITPEEAIEGETDEERIAREMSSIYVEPPKKRRGKKQRLLALAKKIIKRFGRWVLGNSAPSTPKSSSHRLIKLGIVCLPVFWYVASVGFSLIGLWAGAREATMGRPVAARRFAQAAWASASGAKTLIKSGTWLLELVGQGKLLRGQERLVGFLGDVAATELNSLKLAEAGKTFALAYLLPNQASGGTGGEAASSLDRLARDFDSVDSQLGLVQANLEVLLTAKPFPLGLGPVSEVLAKKQLQLIKWRKTFSIIHNLLTIYPKMSGFAQKQTYLLLLQNSTELRPTGGFIGSLAQVTLSSGKLTQFTLQDVYTIDGQLRGHVDPPQELRDLLGAEHWYLRDSNWDPDFPTSAARAAWFYEKETGISVDGVIAISTPFITELLAAVGPVDLPDYNDRITASNFYAKSLFYTQVDFFPGSTQKKDFLGLLSQQLLAKLTASSAFTGQLVSGVTEALTRGDLQLYFADPALETSVSRYGWAGRLLPEESCTKEGCLDDFMGLVEGNVGINKVNYFVTRQVGQQVTIKEDGSLGETVSINYHNASGAGSEATGGGVYKTFTRIMVPVDSQLTSVALDGQPVPGRPGGRPTDASLPYTVVEERPDSLSIGVALTVPPGADRILMVAYKRGRFLTFDKTLASYQLVARRQPGLMNTSYSLSLVFPALWTAQPQRLGDAMGGLVGLAKGQELEYNTALTSHARVTVQFHK